MLLELRLDERQGQLRPDQRDVAAQLEQIGNGADVVLVTVREDHADHVIQPITQRCEVRQDQVDAGLVLLREQHPDIHDEDLALELVCRHVAADLAETADRDDPEGARLEGGRVDDVAHGGS